MKQTILNLMHATGAFVPFRLANRGKALIVTYHRFSRSGERETTSASAFCDQLDYLTAHYRIVPLSVLVGHLNSAEPLPRRLAVLAIDDGYRDAYQIAFPILRRYNAAATLFVVTDFVDGKIWLWPDKLRFIVVKTAATTLNTTINNRRVAFGLGDPVSRLETARQINSLLKLLPDDEKEKTILRVGSSLGVALPDAPPDEYGAITWEQAREMNAGGVEIESHTRTHPILTNVSDERLLAELCESRSRIEATMGGSSDLLCYPNGDYDERVRRAAVAAGYRSAVTVEQGLNGVSSDVLQLRRVHTENNFVRFIQRTSGFEQIKNRVLYSGAKTPSGQQQLFATVEQR